MFVYPKRDETFFKRISGYLNAGLDNGEMCVCITPIDAGRILQQMQSLGMDTDHAVKSGQLAIYSFDNVYLRWGMFDVRRLAEFWTEKIREAHEHWKSIRVFGDIDSAMGSRTLRLKLLEYESKANLTSSLMSISMCGYQSSTMPRTLLVQLKDIHPYLASVRSIKTNHRYIDPSRFLNTFYRFQRISKIYAASPRHARECRRHFEEIAARTPMTMDEMEDMKLAVCEAFNNATEHGCAGVPEDLRHIHVCFHPQTTGFRVEVRDHGPGFIMPPDDETPEPQGLRKRGLHLMRNLVSAVDVERRRDDTVVTLYQEYRFPFGR